MAAEHVLLAVLWGGVTLYALLGGADFGTGVWEFSTAGRGSKEERELHYDAIGPVWEANHVWLIFVLVLLWTAFPVAFAALMRALWVPLLLALVGIVFRGASFGFRHYAHDVVRAERPLSAVFAFASTGTPLALGAAAGAVASRELEVTATGDFTGDPLLGWLTPTSVFTALLAVATCAYMAGVFLCREARDRDKPALVELWRKRSIGTGIWMGVLAAAGLAVIATDAPRLWEGFQARALPIVALSAVGGLGSLVALWKSKFTLAAAGAVVAVASVVIGWGVAQYPYLVPPTITVDAAKAGPKVLRLAVVVAGIGTLVLGPSLYLLFRIFKVRRVGDPPAAS